MNLTKSLNRGFFILVAFKFGGLLGVWNLEKKQNFSSISPILCQKRLWHEV